MFSEEPPRNGMDTVLFYFAPAGRTLGINKFGPIYDFFFPILAECPRPKFEINVLGLKLQGYWPLLFATILIGISIGVFCSVKLFRQGLFYWGFAFMFFGMMNIFGLFCHCLLDFGFFSDLFALGDLISTIVSSMGIIHACYHQESKLLYEKNAKHYFFYGGMIIYVHLFLILFLTIFIHYWAPSLHSFIETMYPSYMIVAAFMILRIAEFKGGKRSLKIGFIGIIVGYAMIAFDRVFCEYFFGIGFAFLSCDVAFVLIYRSVSEGKFETSESKTK